MKKSFLIILALFSAINCFGQKWEQVFKYELRGALSKISDSIYIEDRKHLEKIPEQICTDSLIVFNFKSRSGDNIEIRIAEGSFDSLQHKIYLEDTVFTYRHEKKCIDYMISKNLIDGRFSYGVDSEIPRREIKSIFIKWNGIILSIPETAYSNFYEPHICRSYLKVEAYISKNNENLYLYIDGSDGAGGYAVKFVFDRHEYVTRIITTNEMTNGFDFLDGTAKYDN